MDELQAIESLAALAQATRLAAFRRLIGVYPGGLPAGEIARLCGVPHNTMSTHLAVLTRSGLLCVERRSRSMNYRVDLDGFRALIGFLTRDCCSGRPEICAPLMTDVACCEEASASEATHG